MRNYGASLEESGPNRNSREIFDILRHERQIAYTTVMTTMVRLAEKGMLRIVDRAGLANCYAPVETREGFIKNAVSLVLDIFIKDFPLEANQFLEDYANNKSKKLPTRKR